MTGFAASYLRETAQLVEQLDTDAIESIATGLAGVRDGGGRLFVLGVGGSAAHAGHAAADFRKICGFEAYSPTDNVAELTARVNDAGWETTFAEWLCGSRLNAEDAVLVFSVGGGDREKEISVNLVQALETVRDAGGRVYGVVGRDGGYTKRVADACIVIPTVNEAHVTAHTEGLCAVIFHLLVSHPLLKVHEMKWESVR